jgi:anti-anti-sigma factor
MKEVTTLVSIAPPGRATRKAFRLFLESVRKLQQIPGFRRVQGFRALDASDDLILVLDWNPTAPGCAMELAVCSLVRQAERLGLELGPLEFLEPSHDRTLLRERPVATLLRLARSDDSLDLDRDSELALQAIAAPGTTRIRGDRSDDGSVTACRIDFDSEDGIWHFLESPLRGRWADDPNLTSETWALNLPHFERITPDAGEEQDEAEKPHPESNLAVQLIMSEDRGSAEIRLQGHVDSRNCDLTERFCTALIDEGCLDLQVDVSDLTSISPPALLMLARTARALKAQGGRFTLIDNARRVRRITRTKQLESALI